MIYLLQYIAITITIVLILQSYWFWSTKSDTKEPSYKKFINEFDKQEYDYTYESNQATGSLPSDFIKPK